MNSKNLISTLGTLHDLFLTNPNYGLNHFLSALYQFKPEVILSEVHVERPTCGDASIDGGIEQSIIYAYAEENNIPVIATDWFDNDLIREMEHDNSKVTPDLIDTLERISKFRESFSSSSLLELNSVAIKNYVREIYKLLEENSLMSSRKRNDRILENIKKELAQINGKRVLIIYGMDHKFFIDDHLQSMESNEVVEVESWFQPKNLDSFKITDELKNKIIENLKYSESLLEQRMNSTFYQSEMHEKLKLKAPRFGNWIVAISKI